MTHRRTVRRRRPRHMNTYDQMDLVGCILLGAVIAGFILGPTAAILYNLTY